jgi:hypothetical protein
MSTLRMAGCNWQQNSTAKQISFNKPPSWSCMNYIRYHIIERGPDQGNAAGKWKKIFRRLVLKCLVPNGLIIPIVLVWI